jgi:hypothetical protein
VITLAQQIIESEERLRALEHHYAIEYRRMLLLQNQYAFGLKACHVMNTEAPKHAPTLSVAIAEIPPKQAEIATPARVHVDWWYDTKKQQASGKFSGGSYAVKSDNGKFLTIVFELDKEHEMNVNKDRTKAA